MGTRGLFSPEQELNLARTKSPIWHLSSSSFWLRFSTQPPQLRWVTILVHHLHLLHQCQLKQHQCPRQHQPQSSWKAPLDLATLLGYKDHQGGRKGQGKLVKYGLTSAVAALAWKERTIVDDWTLIVCVATTR